MIYGAISRVLFPVAAVALVGAGMWGYQEHNEKNSILIKTENQYQRAFHDLNYHIDKLNDELGKSVVVNSRKQMTPCLTNVWRLAYAAQSDVGQLPLTLIPFHHTEAFLANVADFSYRVAVRDLSKQPLTQKEYQTLKQLYAHSRDIQKELRNVQTKVLDKRLRWMDVEIAIAGDEKKTDNTIIDGFRTIDHKVEQFSDLDWGPSVKNREQKKQLRIKGLDGKKITKEEAANTAQRFVGVTGKNLSVEVDENGKAEQYSAYSVRLYDKRTKNTIHLDVSKRGGKVVWLLNERAIPNAKLSLDEAHASAVKFLRDHGFPNMVAAEVDRYDNLGVFTFIPEQNGVRIYPDAVTVKVALDNGDVNGFHATEYLFNHKQRIIPKPKITREQARTMVNPHIKVSEQHLALIEGKQDGNEVLCHEFIGRLDGEAYKVYINALTGDEEEVLKMDTRDGTARDNQ